MAKYVFFGRILPERAPLSLSPELKAEGDAPAFGFKFNYRMFIHAGQISTEIEVTPRIENFYTIRNFVESEARFIADIVGFQTGLRFEVEILSMYDCDSGDRFVFGNEIPALLQMKQGGSKVFTQEFFSRIAAEIAPRMALSNFREAMRIATDTGFFSYRAIEAIMQSMKSTLSDADSKGWKRLRDFLNVDRAAIDEVKSHADLPRHGRPSSITDDERRRVLIITDSILDRYLKYIEGAKMPLPLEAYPVLLPSIADR